MNRKPLLALVAVIVVTIVCLLPGCDELVTEVVERPVVRHPTADFSVAVDSGCAPFTVTFTNLTEGPYDSLFWIFGDGSDTLVGDTSADSVVTPTHTYVNPGTYAVRLTVKNTSDDIVDSEFKKRFIIVGTTVSDFFIDVDSGCSPFEVTFTPEDYRSVTTWRWDFGDGSTVSTDSNPTHLYALPGVHTVRLVVLGDCGTDTLVKDSAIEVLRCPSIRFLADTNACCAPCTITFYDSSTVDSGQSIASRSWDFGNGQTSSEQNPSVAFDTGGVFTVSLTITDTQGATATDSAEDYFAAFDSSQVSFSALSDTTACYSQFQQFVVKFQNDTQGDVESYLWSFGDNTTSLDTNPAHAFLAPGRYTIVLGAVSPCGTDVHTRPDMVILSDTLRNPAFSINPDTIGDTLTQFVFQDLIQGAVKLTRQWQTVNPAGDTTNEPSTEQINRTFTDSGYQVIILTVGNDCGTVQAIDSVLVQP